MSRQYDPIQILLKNLVTQEIALLNRKDITDIILRVDRLVKELGELSKEDLQTEENQELLKEVEPWIELMQKPSGVQSILAERKEQMKKKTQLKADLIKISKSFQEGKKAEQKKNKSLVQKLLANVFSRGSKKTPLKEAIKILNDPNYNGDKKVIGDVEQTLEKLRRLGALQVIPEEIQLKF